MVSTKLLFSFYEGILRETMLSGFYELEYISDQHSGRFPPFGGDYEDHARLLSKVNARNIITHLKGQEDQLNVIQTEKLTGQILSTIDYYLLKLSKHEIVQTFPFILSDLTEVREEITSPFDRHSDEQPNSCPKFKWLGDVTALVTLFYELTHGQQKGRDERTLRLLDAEPEDMKEFLKRHFVDSEGNELNEGTIKRVFASEKNYKGVKMGKRVEIYDDGIDLSPVKQKKAKKSP